MPGKKKSKKKVKKNTSCEVAKTPVTSAFRAKIVRTKKYVEHHGAIPTWNCEDTEGKKLFIFLKGLKGDFKKGTLSDEAIGLVNSIDGFSITSGREEKKEEMLKKCIEFVKTNQRLPSVGNGKTKGDKYECTLGNFLNYHRETQGRSLSEEQKTTLMEGIPLFTFQSKRDLNIAQFGTADADKVYQIKKKLKRRDERKAQAKASAELTAQQSSSAKTSAEKYFAHGTDFANEYTNFDNIKKSCLPFAHLGHSSLVPTSMFETCPDDDSKKKLDVKKLKPYDSLSEMSKARVNHNHSQPPQYVYAHASGIGATIFAARHWEKAHIEHIQQHGKIVTLDDGKKVCQILTQLHFIFPWQHAFHMFDQIKTRGGGSVQPRCRLLARCKHPVSPGATLELTLHVPVELMYKSGKKNDNNWKKWSPALFHFHKAVKKTWVHLDGNLEAVLNWDFNDPRVVATQIGIMSIDLYQRKFAALASPLTGMVRSTGKDSDEDSETVTDLEEQDDSLQLAIHKSLQGDDEVTKETSIAGIVNSSNTCFINSVLQAIFPNSQFLLKLGRFYNESTQKSKLPLTKAFLEIAVATGSLKADLFPSISTDNARSKVHGSIAADASVFKTVIDSLTDQFPHNTQQDSHEFLVFLLDKLREEGKTALKAASDNDSVPIDINASDSSTVGTTALPVDECFGLIIRQSLTCLSCQQSRAKDEPYDMLSIQMEGNNEEGEAWRLDQLLQQFFKEEIMEGDEMVMCEKCNCKTPTRMKSTIASLSKTIIIHFKRFFHDENMIPQKNNDKITLRECLPVSFFCSQPEANRSNSVYTLRSVVKHHGKTLASGHYTTDSIRNTNAPREAVGLDWVHSNDRVCTKTTSQDVLNDQNSYLVTYTLKEEEGNSNMDNEATAVTVTEVSSSEESSASTDEESSTDMQVARSDSTPCSSSTIDSDTEESVREVIDLTGNSNANKEIKKQRSRSSYCSSPRSKKRVQVVDFEVIKSRDNNNKSRRRTSKRVHRRKRRRSNSTTASRTEVIEIVDLAKRTKAKSKNKSDDDDDLQMWVRVRT